MLSIQGQGKITQTESIEATSTVDHVNAVANASNKPPLLLDPVRAKAKGRKPKVTSKFNRKKPISKEKFAFASDTPNERLI